MKSIYSIVIFFFLLSLTSNAQEDEIDRWDNWLLVGNKIVFGGQNNFQHSHELQWRVNDNMSALKEWYYEGVLTYSPNAKWEFVPDFRASVKPDRHDFRFGFATIRKINFTDLDKKLNSQLVQQLKYQVDLDTKGNFRQGLRYVVTYNHIMNEKLILSGLIGPFFRWSDSYTGVEFVRGGPVVTYLFDKQHTLALAPLFGVANLGGDDGYAYSFTPMISLIIRVGKDYKYVPAKYINF